MDGQKIADPERKMNEFRPSIASEALFSRLPFCLALIVCLFFFPPVVSAKEVYIENEATAIVNEGKKVEKTTTIIQGDSEGVEVFNEAIATASSSQNDSQDSPFSEKPKPEILSPLLIEDIQQQVAEIARIQNEIQQKVWEKLRQIKARPQILKRIIGPDYKAIKELEQQLEETKHLTEQLEQLQAYIPEQEEREAVDKLIAILTKERKTIEEQIQAEKKATSFFGWIFRIFANSVH